MIKTAYSFCEGLIKAASAYAPLQEFCANRFGKQPVFYFQADEHNPPSKDDMPFVVFYSADVNDEEPTTIERAIIIGSAIEDKEIETANDFAKGLFKGYETLEIFDRHVLNAVKCYLSDRAQYGDSILGTSSLLMKGLYPHFHGVRTLQIVTQRE